MIEYKNFPCFKPKAFATNNDFQKELNFVLYSAQDIRKIMAFVTLQLQGYIMYSLLMLHKSGRPWHFKKYCDKYFPSITSFFYVTII